MCVNCSDWIGQCFACGYIDTNGKLRAKHFYVDDGPICVHIAIDHDPNCPARQGGFCTYQGICDPDSEVR